MKLLVGVGLLGAGGGGAYGMIQTGMLGSADRGKEDNNPRLIRKDEKDPYAPSASGKSSKVAIIYGEGGSKYRTSYFSFAEDFTSNLKHSPALVQASLAASTKRDGRVLMWLQKHELAIRSEILSVLADTPEDEVYTREGKKRLQKRLTAAINEVLSQTEGFGGVDAVHFRTFIVQ